MVLGEGTKLINHNTDGDKTGDHDGSYYVVLATKTEPPRDKTNKVSVHPAKTRISLGIRPV